MNERDYLIEQCLVDAEKGYLVDESMMSWLKGKAAAAKKVGDNIGTALKNGAKNLKAGYKNTLGKMAGGSTHTAAKKEASEIKSSREKYEDATAHGKKIDRANRIKEAGIKRQKQEEKNAKKLQKLAKKALDAVEAYINAGGQLKHGRISSNKTTINSLKTAAGLNDTAEEQTQKASAPKQTTQKKEKKNIDVKLSEVPGVNPHSAEWEETVNHGVAAVTENSIHLNSNAQLKMLNSIH